MALHCVCCRSSLTRSSSYHGFDTHGAPQLAHTAPVTVHSPLYNRALFSQWHVCGALWVRLQVAPRARTLARRHRRLWSTCSVAATPRCPPSSSTGSHRARTLHCIRARFSLCGVGTVRVVYRSLLAASSRWPSCCGAPARSHVSLRITIKNSRDGATTPLLTAQTPTGLHFSLSNALLLLLSPSLGLASSAQELDGRSRVRGGRRGGCADPQISNTESHTRRRWSCAADSERAGRGVSSTWCGTVVPGAGPRAGRLRRGRRRARRMTQLFALACEVRDELQSMSRTIWGGGEQSSSQPTHTRTNNNNQLQRAD
jgi:hypothetical protein